MVLVQRFDDTNVVAIFFCIFALDSTVKVYFSEAN